MYLRATPSRKRPGIINVRYGSEPKTAKIVFTGTEPQTVEFLKSWIQLLKVGIDIDPTQDAPDNDLPTWDNGREIWRNRGDD